MTTKLISNGEKVVDASYDVRFLLVSRRDTKKLAVVAVVFCFRSQTSDYFVRRLQFSLFKDRSLLLGSLNRWLRWLVCTVRWTRTMFLFVLPGTE